MTLPEHIIRSALLGTARVPYTRAETPDALADSLEQESDEAQLLLTIATQNLRAWAGYIPPQTPRGLPDKAQPEETQLCGAKAMRHLRLILSGIHSSALREWLIAATRACQHVPPELLPKLLLLGQKREMHRPYLLPVIGQRGQWLAYEISNQNWNWALETPLYEVDELLTFDRWHEAAIMESMTKQNLTDVGGRTLLDNLVRQYRMVWSPELTRRFMQAVNDYLPQLWSQYLAAGMVTWLPSYSYFFPLDMREEIEAWLKALPGFPTGYAERMYAGLVIGLDFRQSMLNAIETRED